MESRLKFLGHPVHPMVVAYPIALYTVSIVTDLIYVGVGDPFWYRVSFWLILFGVVTNVSAGFTGIFDFLALNNQHPAYRAAVVHLTFGSMIFVVYLIGLFLRSWGMPPEETPWFPIILNLVGGGMLGIQGWYGGELVYRHGIGVERLD